MVRKLCIYLQAKLLSLIFIHHEAVSVLFCINLNCISIMLWSSLLDYYLNNKIDKLDKLVQLFVNIYLLIKHYAVWKL